VGQQFFVINTNNTVSGLWLPFFWINSFRLSSMVARCSVRCCSLAVDSALIVYRVPLEVEIDEEVVECPENNLRI
jgi:hypothetical protein